MLRQVADEICRGFAAQSVAACKYAVHKYRLEEARIEPVITLAATDNWIEFTTRYVVAYQERRVVRDRLFTRIREEVDKSGNRIRLCHLRNRESAARRRRLRRRQGQRPAKLRAVETRRRPDRCAPAIERAYSAPGGIRMTPTRRVKKEKASHRSRSVKSRAAETPAIETPRLLLCPLTLADAAQVQILFPHWEIVRYLTTDVPWPYPPDGAHRFFRDVALPAMKRGEAWHWTLRLKTAPKKVIGGIGLMTRAENNRGFWIVPSCQRKGLMTEATEAVTEFWFDTLGFPLMRVQKAAANAASRRISEKNGMRLVGTIARDYVAGHLPTEIWEISAEEWRARCRAK
jgi:ribosomal-protein-alanine N-acetyltransferase